MRLLYLATTLVLATGCTAVEKPAPGALADLSYVRDGKLPMVQVRVNGAGPYWFIVDSGASRTVLDAGLVEELGLKITGEGATTGTGQGSVPLRYVGSVDVALDGMNYKSEPYVIDLSGTPLSKQVRGLVGSEIFKSHVVQLDPERQRMIVYAPDRPPKLRSGASLPLTVDGGKLFLPATLEARAGRSVDRKLRIDTGSESSVNDPTAAEAELTSATTLGAGLGASFEGVSGKFRSIQLGPYKVEGIWGPGGNPPAIGMEMLQRFTVTFDAPRGRIHLAPNEKLNSPAPHPPGEVKIAG